MTAETTRILKDARPLLWPWSAVAVAGALPLLFPLDWAPLIYLLGFVVVPLLATLSLGDEFQHRTLSLLLSQPVGRMRIWGEKLSLSAAAVVSAVLLFSLALRATAYHPDRQELAFAAAWIAAITASATFWTLFARSTLGGVVLNIAVQSFLIGIIPWASLAERLRARGYLSPLNIVVIPTLAIFCYADVMLWLGWRKLARFQVTGGMAGDDLLMAGPDVTSGTVADWLRCRPTGAALNLIRKELRLLRPVWLFGLLAAVGWACLTLFGVLHPQWSNSNSAFATVSAGEISILMIAILAGALSLGEERTSGAHAWHLTLPAPALLQWRIKLYTALFAGFVGAGLLPLLIAGRKFGSSNTFVDAHLGEGWLLGVLVLTFASFWCACAVKGTVRAVLWVLPVMIALGIASGLGGHAGDSLAALYIARFDPFASFKFTHAVASAFNSFYVFGAGYGISLSFSAPFFYSSPSAAGLFTFFRIGDFDSNPWLARELMLMLAVLWTPTMLLALVQSYRLFRTQIQDSTLGLFRNLLPLAMLAFLCALPLVGFDSLRFQAGIQNWKVEQETLRAIYKTLPPSGRLDATHPQQLTVEDLAKASPLSEHTRRELRDSQVTIAPLNSVPHQDCCADPYGINNTHLWYLTTIRFARGSDCTQSFRFFPSFWFDRGKAKRNPSVRFLVVVCK